MHGRKIDILCVAGFLVVVAVFFYKTLLNGLLPVPTDSLIGLYHPWRDALASEYPRGLPFKNFLITDPVRQQIPWRKTVIDQWKSGKLPRWNSFSFSGTPLAANIQAGTLYPLNILFFVLPFPVAWTALIVLQPILAGVYLYLYLRKLKVSELASLLGAITWSFSGFSIAWFTWGTMVHAALWLPLALLAIDRKKPYLLLFALTMSLFAGHSQIALYVFVTAGVYAIYRKSFFLFSWLGVVIVSLVQLIPFVRLVSQSGRLSELGAWSKPGWFLPWQHLAQFIAPDFFGNPTTLNYTGVWNYGEFIGYIGIISLIFVFLALRLKETRFWVGVLVVSLVFMFPNPIARIPILASLQPTRLMVLVSLSLSVLSAFGFDRFLKDRKKPILPFIILVISLLVLWGVSTSNPVAKRNLILPTVLFLFGSAFLYLPKKISSFAIIGLITFDLLRFAWKFTPFTEAKYFFPETEVIEFLQQQKKPFRIASVDAKILPPNTSAYFGIESIEGYDPIILRSYEEFIAASERGKPDITPPYGFNRIITPHNIDSPLIPLLNVRYVLSFEDLKQMYLKKVFQEGETLVYEDSRNLPRAYFVEGIAVETNRQKILEKLFEKDFKPLETALVEKSIPLLSTPVMLSEFVLIKEYRSDAIAFDVQAQNDRFMVISNIFYPGWHAQIDGKPVEIYRTNYLFQGIVIPPGRHVLVVRYQG